MVTTEQVLKKIVNEFHLKALDDGEARHLLDRLESVPEENRMGVGLLNFFGYHRDFLRSLSDSDKLRSILVKGAEFKAEVDYAVVEFLQEKAAFYSSVLLADAPDVGELARLAVPSYIFSRFAIKYVKNTGSEVLEEVLRSGRELPFYEGADVGRIKADLLEEVRRLDDHPADDIHVLDARSLHRRERLRAARDAFRTEEALAQRFDEDWEALRPVRMAIEKRMLGILPHSPTIVIEDMGALDDDSRFGKLLARVRSRFQGSQ